MGNLPRVSIVIVNWNGLEFLNACLNSLNNLNYPKSKLEIILVDNNSIDGSVKFVKENFPQVRTIKLEGNNYCKSNNVGIKAAKGKYVALLNNDTIVDKNWLIELVKVIEKDKKIGGVGGKILFMDGKINSAGQKRAHNFSWYDI